MHVLRVAEVLMHDLVLVASVHIRLLESHYLSLVCALNALVGNDMDDVPLSMLSLIDDTVNGTFHHIIDSS